jgi:recombinational DNA repair protein (RecF pathway)
MTVVLLDFFICSVCCFENEVSLNKNDSVSVKELRRVSSLDEYRPRSLSEVLNDLVLFDLPNRLLGKIKFFSHSFEAFRLCIRRLELSNVDTLLPSERLDLLINDVLFSSLSK